MKQGGWDKRRDVVLWLLLLPAFLWSQSMQRYSYEHPQMGTLFRIVLYADSEALAERAARAAFIRIDSLNAVFSDYEASSELSRLAEKAANGPVTVSADLWRVLSSAQTLAHQSGGAFDISIGPLSRLWRRAFRRQAFPEMPRLQEAAAKVGYQMLHLDTTCRTVWFQQPGMRLDAGGIAKGDAVDEAMTVLQQFGIERALIDGGGDLRVGRAPPGQPGWTIQIKTVDQTGSLIDSTVMLQRSAIATSGDKYRYLEWKGRRYSHIIDPRTGFGTSHQALVSVRCSSCRTADALASAISVLGPKAKLKPLLSNYPDCRAQLIVPTERDEYRQQGSIY